MPSDRIVETTVHDGLVRIGRPGTEWLSTGYDGGRSFGDAVDVLSVPEGFDRTDLDEYVRERLASVDLDPVGPALLTGVDVGHARIARSGPAAVVATAGVSNPAALFPVDVADELSGRDRPDSPDPVQAGSDHPRPGTVNVVAVVDRACSSGALANLVAIVAEAKAATLCRLADVPGTTSDAVVVGCDPDGDPAAFSGSATETGAAVRACVRDAVTAAFRARYADSDPPTSVADAEHGTVTVRRTEVSRP